MANDRRWAWAGVTAVLVGAAALYAQVLAFGYVWDDLILFVNNTALHVGGLEWAELAPAVFPDTTYFRPVVLGTFAVQFQLFGPGPLASHAVNLALYLANVLLVAALAFAYVRRLGLSGMGWRVPLAALVYALHPALVESTAWVSGRFDQMVTLFVVAALLADVAIARTWHRATVIAVCFALALGSKELAVTLPLLLVLQRLALDGDRARLVPALNRALRGPANGLIWLLCALVLAAYIVVRPHGFGDSLTGMRDIEGGFDTPLTRARWVLQTVTFYLQQSLMPLLGSPAPVHPIDPQDEQSMVGMAKAVVGAIACIGIAIAALRWRSTLGWLLAMWLLGLVLVLHIVAVPMGDNIGHDRFLTLPLVFLALAVAVAEIRGPALRPTAIRSAVVIGVVVWAGLAAANVGITVPMWRDNGTLWKWSYFANPRSMVAQEQFIDVAMRERRADLALPVLQDLIDSDTASVGQRLHFGYALISTGRPRDGIGALEQLLTELDTPLSVAKPQVRALTPEDLDYTRAYALFLVAETYLRLGEAEKSLQNAERALSLRPKHVDGLMVSSVAFEVLGQVEASDRVQATALEVTGPEAGEGWRKRRTALLAAYRAAVQGSQPATP